MELVQAGEQVAHLLTERWNAALESQPYGIEIDPDIGGSACHAFRLCGVEESRAQPANLGGDFLRRLSNHLRCAWDIVRASSAYRKMSAT